MPFLRSGAGSTASDRSHRFRRGSTVWRRTPASTRCGGEKNRAAASRSTTRSCLVDAVDTSPQPQETVEHREAQKLLQEGLSALPEEYRKVLILREIEGLSYTEIAESASIKLGTVKSRISRGRHFCATFYPETGTFLKLLRQKLQNVIVRR